MFHYNLDNKFNGNTLIELDEYYAKEVLFSDTTSDLALIPIDDDHKIYFWCEGRILCYDTNSEVIKNLIPDNWDIEQPLTYNINIVGNHMYCMFNTYACGAGNDLAVYYLDIREDTWHHVVNCDEGSDFVGDSIMAYVHWITKEGFCSAANEYGDSIRWIKLD